MYVGVFDTYVDSLVIGIGIGGVILTTGSGETGRVQVTLRIIYVVSDPASVSGVPFWLYKETESADKESFGVS